MRSAYLLVGALLMVPTISATDWQEAREGIGVTLLRADESFVHVSWTVAPGAVSYELYRGPTLDDLQLITQTPNLEYADAYAPDEDVWYVVVSRVPSISTHVDPEPMRGKCLSLRGYTGVTITVANCLPMRL